MNIKMRYLAAIAAGMLMTTGIVASERMHIVGVGAYSCGKVVVNIKDDQSNALYSFAWVQGFLSGLNIKYLLKPESSTDLSDHDALRLWMENYCKENPLDDYAVAAGNLWTELRVRQGLDLDLFVIPEE